jgi:hypothetical protein
MLEPDALTRKAIADAKSARNLDVINRPSRCVGPRAVVVPARSQQRITRS